MNLCICYNRKETYINADIIGTLIQPKYPALKNNLIKNNAHINAVGSCSPDNRELDFNTIYNSFVVVDNYTSAKNQAGDIILVPNKTLIANDLTNTYCFSLINSSINKKSEKTVFESLSFAAEDIATALLCYKTYINKKN